MIPTKRGSGSVGSILHPSVHCRQQYSWDCGVASVMMLLSPEARAHLARNLEAVCQEEGFKHNTWTIDLCYLMKRYGVESELYSTTLGASEGHRVRDYYRGLLDQDCERVAHRFRSAPSVGIGCERRAVDAARLVAWLARGPLLLLVDAGLLLCRLCKLNNITSELRGVRNSYRGHYIVAVGLAGGRVLYRDPARSTPMCVTSVARLQRARAARGTDLDLVRVTTQLIASQNKSPLT